VIVGSNNTTQVDLQRSGPAFPNPTAIATSAAPADQLQFVRGAYAVEEAGKVVFILPLHPPMTKRRGPARSRIVLSLTHGTVVTTPAHPT